MRGWLALPFVFLPFAALAQTAADTAADKDFLTTWLQDNLSGAGRTVTIDGFQGALSSHASLQQLTIADDQGIWLTLKDVTLDWSRSALLTGNIQVDQLSAGEIDFERVPSGGPASELPSPKARSLALPDLPVSIAIKGIAAQKIVLGPTILGQPVEATLAADLTLANGEGTAHFDLKRLGDGPEGHVTLAAGFSNQTQILDLSLDASEGAGGIAATLLHVPGAPATSLTIAGKGPLSDFAATVNLTTDGQTRLAGQITQTDDAAGNRSFSADLAGDLTPMFLPEYAEFFGPNVALQAKGQRLADGTLQLDKLSVQARALSLQGKMVLLPSGEPASLDFKGSLGLPDGPVTLPTASTEPVKIGHADLALTYDKSRGDDWDFETTITQLDNSSLTAGELKLTATGTLAAKVFNGTARFSASSLAPRDPGLAQAMGTTLSGSSDFSWNRDTLALDLANLALTAPGYAVTTQGSMGLKLDLNGKASGHYDDLSRLALLTGQPLSGSARFDVQGTGNPMTGAFDVAGNLSTTKLGLGIAQADALLSSESTLQFSARRDETGTTLRKFSLRAASLSADLTGSVTEGGSDLTGSISFADLSALGPGYRGSLSGMGDFKGTLSHGSLTATAEGQDIAVGQAQADAILAGKSALQVDVGFENSVLTIRAAQIVSDQGKVVVTGTASTNNSDLKASLSLPDLAVMGAGYKGGLEGSVAFTGAPDNGTITLDAKGSNLAVGEPTADKLLRGDSTGSAQLSLTPDGTRVDRAELSNPQLKASVTGAVSGNARNLTVSAQLANLGLLYPEFPGAVTIDGTAQQSDKGTTLDLVAKGPGQIDAKVVGMVAPDYKTADLGISGSATAALANAFIAPRSLSGAVKFDLKLAGPLAITSLSGPVSISGGRFADPSLPFDLRDVAASIRLNSGQAQISATTAMSSGGKIAAKGTVGLAAPYSADLAINLDQAVLKDPSLYATTINGAVTFRGPALGGATIAGRIRLGKTELQIPSTGLGGEGDLPGLKHIHENADVKATRTRAGVGVSTAAAPAGPGYALDLQIFAPNQVFIRGRGLDAELGGHLTLRGTTDNIVPAGSFDLIRGRLEILGRRLVLSEAEIQMQGALIPFVHIVASVESDGITSSILIEGEATDPKVTFTSNPDLPQDEVVARLLFDHGLDKMSPLQAVQLASAVATLAGKGGQGVVGSLRQKTGLDDLDVQADAEGNASVTAGKYLSDKTYSEVTVDQAGKSSVSLNYDVSRHVTLKLSVDSESDSTLGVFIQRDY